VFKPRLASIWKLRKKTLWLSRKIRRWIFSLQNHASRAVIMVELKARDRKDLIPAIQSEEDSHIPRKSNRAMHTSNNNLNEMKSNMAQASRKRRWFKTHVDSSIVIGLTIKNQNYIQRWKWLQTAKYVLPIIYASFLCLLFYAINQIQQGWPQRNPERT